WNTLKPEDKKTISNSCFLLYYDSIIDWLLCFIDYGWYVAHLDMDLFDLGEYRANLYSGGYVEYGFSYLIKRIRGHWDGFFYNDDFYRRSDFYHTNWQSTRLWVFRSVESFASL
ncbi:hypothetical protein, partial [Bacillus sp. V3-13]|uniref:hypothetical protein n=1 Tax=Bacillus sp. V3-13 TaxID=2053728 RepID=UPI001C60CD6A